MIKMDWKTLIIEALGGTNVSPAEYETTHINLASCNTQLSTLQSEYDKLYVSNQNNLEIIKEYEEITQEQDKKIQDLESATPTINDVNLDTYFKSTKTTYYWKPGKKIYLHESLNNFSQDTEYIQKYLEFLTGLGITEYSTPEKQVYHIVRKVQEWINLRSDDYDRDKESFGANEYWLSPQEAFDYYVLDEDVGDCEDTCAFLYGCIVSKLIQKGWSESIWRLIRIDLMIIGSEGHAILAWLRDDLFWCPIESTFAEERFYNVWTKKADIFRSTYVDVYHIFNEEIELKLK